MSIINSSLILPQGSATYTFDGGELDITGTVLLEDGTTVCGGAGINTLDPSATPTAALGVVNATVDSTGPFWDPNLLVGLIGNSHLIMQSGMEFISPLVLTGTTQTIAEENITDFAGLSYNAQTSTMDFVNHNDRIDAAIRVYNLVPNTAWYASVSGETVTIGLVMKPGHF
jgi:hypothetical protein